MLGVSPGSVAVGLSTAGAGAFFFGVESLPQLVRAGDVLVSNIKAWEGAIAVATPEDDGRYGSHRYLTYAPVNGIATARFVCFYLLTPEGLHHVGEASPGSADRNRTTSAKALEEIQVPLPRYGRQLWFGELYDKVEA